MAAVLVAVVGLVGIHDQLAIRDNEAHNLWAYPELPSNGQPVDYQGAAAYVRANARPGDDIVFQTSDLNHYQVDTAMEYYLRSKLPVPVFQAQTQDQANSLAPNSFVDPSAVFTGGTPRVWVVFVDHLAPDPFSALPSAAAPNRASEANVLEVYGYQVKSMWQENGITVALLTTD